MDKFAIILGTEYAIRERRVVGSPFQLAKILDHICHNKWKAKWIDPTVPLENLERSERMRVTSFIISSMLTALMTLLATLSSIFRSRAALELENLCVTKSVCFGELLQNA
jgi:hypothetical protein